MVINLYVFGRIVSDKSHIYYIVKRKGNRPQFWEEFTSSCSWNIYKCYGPSFSLELTVRGCQLRN